jgi:hypothetical protein
MVEMRFENPFPMLSFNQNFSNGYPVGIALISQGVEKGR